MVIEKNDLFYCVPFRGYQSQMSPVLIQVKKDGKLLGSITWLDTCTKMYRQQVFVEGHTVTMTGIYDELVLA